MQRNARRYLDKTKAILAAAAALIGAGCGGHTAATFAASDRGSIAISSTTFYRYLQSAQQGPAAADVYHSFAKMPLSELFGAVQARSQLRPQIKIDALTLASSSMLEGYRRDISALGKRFATMAEWWTALGVAPDTVNALPPLGDFQHGLAALIRASRAGASATMLALTVVPNANSRCDPLHQQFDHEMYKKNRGQLVTAASLAHLLSAPASPPGQQPKSDADPSKWMDNLSDNLPLVIQDIDLELAIEIGVILFKEDHPEYIPGCFHWESPNTGASSAAQGGISSPYSLN